MTEICGTTSGKTVDNLMSLKQADDYAPRMHFSYLCEEDKESYGPAPCRLRDTHGHKTNCLVKEGVASSNVIFGPDDPERLRVNLNLPAARHGSFDITDQFLNYAKWAAGDEGNWRDSVSGCGNWDDLETQKHESSALNFVYCAWFTDYGEACFAQGLLGRTNNNWVMASPHMTADCSHTNQFTNVKQREHMLRPYRRWS